MLIWILHALIANPTVDFAHTQPFDVRQNSFDRLVQIHPLGFFIAFANRDHDDAEVRSRCRDYLQRKSRQGFYAVRVIIGMMSLPKDIIDGFNLSPVPKITTDQFEALCVICESRELFDPSKEALNYEFADGMIWEMRTRIRVRTRMASVVGGLGVARK